jgi:hypothetical protein
MARPSLSNRIARFICVHRWGLFALGCLLSAVSVVGITQLHLRNDFRSYISEDTPALQSSDWLSNRMVDTVESASLVYLPSNRQVFSDIGLIQYAQIAEQSKQLPHVLEARSLFDAEKIARVVSKDGAPKGAVAAPFFLGADLYSDAGRMATAAEAARTPTIQARYVSRNGDAAAVVLSLDLSRNPMARLSQIRALQEAVSKLSAEAHALHAGDKIVLAGASLFDEATFSVFQKELPPLFAIAVLLIGVVLFIIYRSLAFVALALVVIFTPVAVTAGLVAFFGIEFSVLTASGLLLVGTLAVADVMHLANGYFLHLGRGDDSDAAMEGTLTNNLWAVTATSTTTAIGEAVLLFSASPAVVVMGLTVMIGVFVALALALLLLPGPLARLHSREPRPLKLLSNAAAACAVFSARHAQVILATFALLGVISVMGVMNARLNDTVTNWFGRETAFRQAMETYETRFVGAQAITVALETPLKDVAALRKDPSPSTNTALAPYVAYRGELEKIAPGIWMSPLDTLRASQASAKVQGHLLQIPEGDVGDLRAPTSDTVARSGLFTPFEPGRGDYSLWRSDGAGQSSFATVTQADAIEAATNRAFPEQDVKLAGLGYAFAQVSVSNFYNILLSSLVVIAVMSLCLIVVFRSVKLGLWSVIPNTAPILAVYGAWGYFVGEFNLASITMFAVALGIVVDDTIHFVLTYRRVRADGLAAKEAIAASVHEGSGGVFATTALVVLGFALLAFTSFELTAQKAAMTAVAIAVALVFDLTMLPALLVTIDGDIREDVTQSN